MNIYIDIDGTLTIDGFHPGASPLLTRVEMVRKLSQQHTVVLWSGNGESYARKFAAHHRLARVIPLGKPHLIIDDQPQIRPNWATIIKPPEVLDQDTRNLG